PDLARRRGRDQAARGPGGSRRSADRLTTARHARRPDPTMTTVHDHAGSDPLGGAGRDRRTTARLVAAVFLGAVLTLFAVLNSQTVRVHWIVTTTDVPMIVVIVVAGLLGALVSWLIARRRHRSA